LIFITIFSFAVLYTTTNWLILLPIIAS
jgi:hypothetical protein